MDESRLLRLASFTALAFAIAFGVVIVTAILWNRSFQVDEVEHIHGAYNMRDGRVLYRDFWQGHNPLLYVLIAPVMDVDDPVGSFHRARIVTGLLLMAIVGLVAYCGFRLGGLPTALGGAAFSLFHTTLMERGMEVRPDGGVSLATMAALAVEIRGRGTALARFSAQAVLLGLGFLFSQKAIFPAFAFGCLWLFDAWKERRPRLVLQPVLLWFAPLACALLVMLPFGCAQAFIQQNILDAFFAGAGAEYRKRFSPVPGLLHESARNPLLVLLALAGIAWLATRRKRPHAFVAFLAVVLTASLWANPFPWPYVHVSALPVLMLAAASAIAAADGRWGKSGAVIAGALAIAMLTAVPRFLQKAAPGTALQFATLLEIQRVTTEDDRLFDLAGLYFRPDAYPSGYAMSGELLNWYAHGGFPRMVPELRRHACAGVLLNYRTLALPKEERRFIASHYVHYWSNLYLPGAELSNAPAGSTHAFEVMKGRAYRYEGNGLITIDGRPFVRGELTAGTHTIAVVRASTEARLIVDTPAPVPPRVGPSSLYVNFD